MPHPSLGRAPSPAAYTRSENVPSRCCVEVRGIVAEVGLGNIEVAIFVKVSHRDTHAACSWPSSFNAAPETRPISSNVPFLRL